MLQIEIEANTLFNEATLEFIEIPKTILKLEHSLLSISKWESKWHKSFISNLKDLKNEEIIDYIRCMTLNTVDDRVYNALNAANINKVVEYINDPMTGTTINEHGSRHNNGKFITNELIYSWMAALQIPFEPCEKWHFNRLMTLIRVCNANQESPKKMSKGAIYNRNKSLNAARRAQMHSKG